MEEVILVNQQDEPIGFMEKIEAHKKGLLHRAFSVFIFNNKNELLLQRRSTSKYHSGGLWSNSCCSHPRKNETIIEAGKRRLVEELGFTVDLSHSFSFIYKAKLDHSLYEHELDHVLLGFFNEQPKGNPEEVEEVKFVSLNWLEKDLNENPNNYTVWFKIIFDRVKTHLMEMEKSRNGFTNQ